MNLQIHYPCMWLLHCDSMTEDILTTHRQELADYGLQFADHLYNQCLCHIQDKVFIMGGQELDFYGLPTPDASACDQMPLEYFRQVNCDREEQAALTLERKQQLTEDQCSIYTKLCPWLMVAKVELSLLMYQVEQARLSS